VLQAELGKFSDKIHWGAIYGSIAHREEGPASDIDLLIVGDVATANLVLMLQRVEYKFGRAVNVKRYSEQEFSEKVRDGDHFLQSVLRGELVSLVGSRDELEKVTGRT
jgi:predicted nucleotidyltransferase